MSLMTAERDRGTLAWSLTTPVARPAILLAKWAAGVSALGALAIFVPLAMQIVIATIACGSLPDIVLIAGFGLVYLIVPAFWVALALTLGTLLSSTAGVAGIGMLVLFLPGVIGSFAPTCRGGQPHRRPPLGARPGDRWAGPVGRADRDARGDRDPGDRRRDRLRAAGLLDPPDRNAPLLLGDLGGVAGRLQGYRQRPAARRDR
jgi:hypothetical protein